MASIDHTARARPSVRKQDKTKQPFIGPMLYPLSAELEQRQSYASRLAGISLGILVLKDLLDQSNALHRAAAQGKRSTINPWPLTAVKTNGVQAALYFLKQYADSLSPESGG